MKLRIEAEFDRSDFEQWISEALAKKGKRLADAEEGASSIKWIVGGLSNPDGPTISAKVMAEEVPLERIPPGTIYNVPATGSGLPPQGTRPGPNPMPSTSRRILSREEIDELGKLLPHPEFAEKILNPKLAPRDLLPGESTDRPD